LARAGQWLERGDWVERASGALDTLLERMGTDGDRLVHFRPGDDEDRSDDYPPTGLLGDLLHPARAAVAVADAADRDDALEHAIRLARTMKDTLWDEAGGFQDHPPARKPLGTLRYPDRPFEENALAARLHIRLARRTGDRSYRAVAERLLAFLAPYAGRYAVEGATFAMAVEEFFERTR
nr:hypothetical protein [Gemmatimonadota bacterium]NIQ59860.1 hypothetical protein [Gemmatimonadota bacterium]NIU80061.1 hypothetical protein [Gammaproteobacteria bacterium]NIX48482.1 hypothetical protein [Gemmatimonadota bacterium]NIY12927.1 hypothetical protein [Gemmatimonadota bacterium]